MLTDGLSTKKIPENYSSAATVPLACCTRRTNKGAVILLNSSDEAAKIEVCVTTGVAR